MPYSVVTAQQACSTEMVKVQPTLTKVLLELGCLYLAIIIVDSWCQEINYSSHHEEQISLKM